MVGGGGGALPVAATVAVRHLHQTADSTLGIQRSLNFATQPFCGSRGESGRKAKDSPLVCCVAQCSGSFILPFVGPIGISGQDSMGITLEMDSGLI